MVDRLEIAEENLKAVMCPFLTAMFSKFHDHKIMWMQILTILTELDCLASLSIVSGHLENKHVRPKFRDFEKNGKTGYIDFKTLIHPCVAA